MKIICALVLFLTATITYADQNTLDSPETPIAVEVVNTPTIRHEAISPSDLRSEEFKISTVDGIPSMKISFQEEVILHDISFAPIPPFNRRISGVCRIKVLINDVPLALGGWSLDSLNKPSMKNNGRNRDDRPCGNFAEVAPGECAPVTTLVVDVMQVKLPAIEMTPNDWITVVMIPTQDDTDTDCEADFVVVAVATTPPL